MERRIAFTPRERKKIRQFLQKEKVTSFSQTYFPFLLFWLPSVFLFVLYLSDGQPATVIISYVWLSLAYFLVMLSDCNAIAVLADIVGKYEQFVREHQDGPPHTAPRQESS